ncbi:virulence-associated protein VapB [Pelomonas sp. V22]|uniref:antitoxin n=1 Tax=Pelomonas sp. V22 TaxID=2822139 RepID=UPI0024A87893|nr:virulence-associated protein VapB [Pelomonas sp. V22]MDI4632097.1 virulence-associated protein VapB [Pelomonas sp. V22]
MPSAKESSPAYAGDTPERHVRLFRNGANQAVRIPREFELPGSEALMYRDGERLIIEPIKPRHPKGSPAALLEALERMALDGPIDVEFPDVDAGLLPLDDIDLSEPGS